MTQARPATRDGAPTRLLSPPLALTFVAEFSSLTSFFLLLSVLPMLAAVAASILMKMAAINVRQR